MPAGLEVIKPDGSILLDSNVTCLSVASKGRMPGQTPPVSSLSRAIATGPIDGAGAYDWWALEPGVLGANFGLQTFDAAGNLMFCAARQTARVVDYFGLGIIGSADIVRSYPAGKVYGAYSSITQFTEVQLRGAGMFQEYRILNWRTVAEVYENTVTAGWRNFMIADWTPVPPEGQASFPAPAYTPQVFVLDMTGY